MSEIISVSDHQPTKNWKKRTFWFFQFPAIKAKISYQTEWWTKNLEKSFYRSLHESWCDTCVPLTLSNTLITGSYKSNCKCPAHITSDEWSIREETLKFWVNSCHSWSSQNFPSFRSHFLSLVIFMNCSLLFPINSSLVPWYRSLVIFTMNFLLKIHINFL